MILTGK